MTCDDQNSQEHAVWSARWRLGSLWISHVARVMADNCLRIVVALHLASLGSAHKQSAWHLVTLLLVVPAVAFAPFNGAICNSLPKPRVLAGSALLPAVFYIVAGMIGADTGLIL